MKLCEQKSWINKRISRILDSRRSLTRIEFKLENRLLNLFNQY